MKRLNTMFNKIVSNENGGEVLEYALVAGLLVVVCLIAVGAVGTRVPARWNSVGSSM